MAFCGVCTEEKVEFKICPTVIDAKDFDAEADAKILHGALGGVKNDKKEFNKHKIIDLIVSRSSTQLIEVESKFKNLFGEEIKELIRNAIKGKNLQSVLAGHVYEKNQYLAYIVREAMSDKDTDKQTLIDVVCTKNTDEMKTLKKTYNAMYDSELEKDLEKATSGDLRRVLVALAAAVREEKKASHDLAKSDAQILYNADGGKWGTDDKVFNIFTLRSYEQLRLTFVLYKELKGYSIFDSVEKQMGGAIKSAFQTIVQYIEDPMTYYAEVLHESMKAIGRDYGRIIRTIMSRCEIDLKTIKERYEKLNGETLENAIQKHYKGCFRRSLLPLVKDP